MGSLLKPWVVRYLDADGRQVPKESPGAKKVKERASKWYGQYTDQDGRRRRVPLCTDKAAARQKLAELERDVQRGEAGMTDPFAEHRQAAIAAHVQGFEDQLRLKEVSAKTLKEDVRRLRAVIDGCGFRSLGDITKTGTDKVPRFLLTLANRGTGSMTRNTYLKSIKAFCNWCVSTDRMSANPLTKLKRTQGEIRRHRRALTEDELVRLIQATRERPLAWAKTIRMGARKGQQIAKVKPETLAAIERLSWEHALIYKTLVLTGLRRGELEALEVRHLTLTGRRHCLILPTSVTKNRKGANLPLRADLAADLVQWLKATGKKGADRVFNVSPDLRHLLRRDMKWAGIPYKDELGRTIDVHALRHTTATHMGKGKVNPTIAQGFMRHSDINLTLETYTDIKLLDENEALDALPNLPLQQQPERRNDKATG